MPREMKYETAMRQLETIAEKMENGELDIDSLCMFIRIYALMPSAASIRNA